MKGLRPELCGEDRSDTSAGPAAVTVSLELALGCVLRVRSSGWVGALGGWSSHPGSWDSMDRETYRETWACLGAGARVRAWVQARVQARVQAPGLASCVGDTPFFLEMDRLSVFACSFVLNEKWGLGVNLSL